MYRMHTSIHVYTALHDVHNNAYTFIRHYSLPHEMTEDEYKQYLEYTNVEIAKSKVRFYAWGAVPASFQISSLFTQQDSCTLSGMDFHISMKAGDVPAYLQFIQDSIALEKRRPVFQHRTGTKTGTNEPEFMKMFQTDTGKVQDVNGYNMDGFQTIASCTDFSVSVNTQESIILPECCTIIIETGDVSNKIRHNTLALLITLNQLSEISVFQPLFAKYGSDFTFFIMFSNQANVQTLEYDFFPLTNTFTRRFGGEWTQEGLEECLKQQLIQRSITLLQLTSGILVKDREDGFWFTILEKNINERLSIRGNKVVWTSADKEQKKIVSAEQAELLSELLKKAPAGLSLSSCFSLFSKSKETETSPIPDKPLIKKSEPIGPSLSDRISLFSEMKKAEPKKSLVSVDKDDTFFEHMKEVTAGLAKSITLTLPEYSNPRDYPKEWDSEIIFMSDVRRAYIEYMAHGCGGNYYIPVDMEKADLKTMYQELKPSFDWLMKGSAPLHTKLIARFHIQSGKRESYELLRTVIGIFAEQCLKREENQKLSASEMWQEFQNFLRSDSEYPGYSTSIQSQFNEILAKFGFTQKRTAAGKIWCNAKLTKE